MVSTLHVLARIATQSPNPPEGSVSHYRWFHERFGVSRIRIMVSRTLHVLAKPRMARSTRGGQYHYYMYSMVS